MPTAVSNPFTVIQAPGGALKDALRRVEWLECYLRTHLHLARWKLVVDELEKVERDLDAIADRGEGSVSGRSA